MGLTYQDKFIFILYQYLRTFSDSLQQFANDITSTVNVNKILPMMVQKSLITLNEYEYLSNPLYIMSDKQQKLSGIILGLPEDCVEKFLHCLLETSDYEPHKQLYDKLHTFIHTTE